MRNGPKMQEPLSLPRMECIVLIADAKIAVPVGVPSPRLAGPPDDYGRLNVPTTSAEPRTWPPTARKSAPRVRPGLAREATSSA